MDDATFTAFIGPTLRARGSRAALTRALAGDGPHPAGLMVFCDETGRETDLDLTCTEPRDPVGFRPGARPRGRPRLGVKAREVTLLPRHWDWLARQRGGASAALRRLVEAAMQADGGGPNPDAAYRFLTAIAGDLPGYEAALRSLYAGDAAGFAAAMTDWPGDIAAHALQLARLP
jgi:uncharacterized protein